MQSQEGGSFYLYFLFMFIYLFGCSIQDTSFLTGSNPCPRQWKCRILSSGLPGSPKEALFKPGNFQGELTGWGCHSAALPASGEYVF